MAMTSAQATWFTTTFTHLADHVTHDIIGREDAARLALAAMLSPGHTLLEDRPGSGKTALATALASSVQGTPGRIQCTAEMLPSDITGALAPRDEPGTGGPRILESHLVVIDEINRAPEGALSGLLELMGEGRISAGGATHIADPPFLVIATQSPDPHIGPLPPALLDRFQMRLGLPRPGHATSVQILHQALHEASPPARTPTISPHALHQMTMLAATVQVDPVLVDHICRLQEETCRAREVAIGVSVRGALALLRTARVWAAAQGRHYLDPADIGTLVPFVWAHRLMLQPEAEFEGTDPRAVLERLLHEVAAPRLEAVPR